MRKLLNTIYIVNETAYLTVDGENIVCLLEDNEKFRMPFDNVENIICFSYKGCSPALMGKCAEKHVQISFVSPTGKYLASIVGLRKGNGYLRVAQVDSFRKNAITLTQNSMAAKFANCISVIRRSCHDRPVLRDNEKIKAAVTSLKNGIEKVYLAETLDSILGIEGNCASDYFGIYGKLLLTDNVSFSFRNKRPPLDPVNAVLSFLYTVYTAEYVSAIETVGMDSYIGFYHSLRSGRESLACDMVEETRCHVERMTLTLFNLKILTEADFEVQKSGAVWLNKNGKKKVISKWQEKKRTEIIHPYLKQKIPFGLIPYIQSNLMAKYLRGEINEYPCYLNR